MQYITNLLWNKNIWAHIFKSRSHGILFIPKTKNVLINYFSFLHTLTYFGFTCYSLLPATLLLCYVATLLMLQLCYVAILCYLAICYVATLLCCFSATLLWIWKHLFLLCSSATLLLCKLCCYFATFATLLCCNVATTPLISMLGILFSQIQIVPR